MASSDHQDRDQGRPRPAPVTALPPRFDEWQIELHGRRVIYRVAVLRNLSAREVSRRPSINALYELAHQIMQMRDLSDAATGVKMNWTLANAGNNRNVIPAMASRRDGSGVAATHLLPFAGEGGPPGAEGRPVRSLRPPARAADEDEARRMSSSTSVKYPITGPIGRR